MSSQATEGFLSPWLQRKRLEKIKPYLHGSILDFGCGNGSLANLCSSDLYYGYDIDDESIDIAKKTFPEYQFSKNLPEKKFDNIIMLAVIEHVKSPEMLIKQMSELLTESGKIILTTPHPYFDWVHTLGAKIGLFSQHANEEHEKLLGLSDMKTIVNNLNLKLSCSKRFLFGANQLFMLTK